MSAKRSTRRTAKPTRKKPKIEGSCFTIMPFGGWFDDYYSTVFVPAIEKAGLESRRADDLYRASTIVSDIWKFTMKAKLVLADLSEKNANVFYELGLAHALAKPVILVVESMDDVPFDLRALRVLQYDKNDPNWGAILHDKIVKSIGEVLADPTQSVPSAFIETKPERGEPRLTSHDKELLTIRRELDLMRREIGAGRISKIETTNGPRIPASEARHHIRKWISRHYPDSIIFRKLESLGVPHLFIENTIKDERLAAEKSEEEVGVEALSSLTRKATGRRVAAKKAVRKKPVKKVASRARATKKAATKKTVPKKQATR